MSRLTGLPVRVLPMGDEAVLLEVADIDEALALRVALEAAMKSEPELWSHVAELVSGARTVLVRFHPGAATTLPTLPPLTSSGQIFPLADREDLPTRRGPRSGTGSVAGDEIEIEVCYDGPDVDAVADLTGLTAAEVVAAHTGTPWRVGFGGFAPGFAYLVGGDPRLRVPRRDTPRARVPAGSVALAGEFSGIYPRESPGGWQVIGTTEAVLWDVDRTPPALLTPGTAVRFVPRSGVHAPNRNARPVPEGVPRSGVHAPNRNGGVEVLQAGPLTLVHDVGRPGLADLGVSPSGAADRAAHSLGARLVGQSAEHASLEVTLGGLAVRACGDLMLALTGAPAPAVIDGRPVPHAAPVPFPSGAVLELGMPLSGLRTYVTFRGGLVPEPVLGSRSTDVLSGLGPAPVRPGDVLPVGDPPTVFPVVDVAPLAAPVRVDEVVTLTVTPGPRLDWFADALHALGHTYTVSQLSNRVGIRLQGKPAQRHTNRLATELPSEGMVRGAVQVPPDGQPVILLADHPVTGGYPVIAVVTARDVDRAAQLRPGQLVRFRFGS